MADKVWVFDLDGTLMDSIDLYRKPSEKAYALLLEVFGDDSPTLSEIKTRHRILDKKLIYQINPLTKKPYLYTKQRFPTSFVEVYKVLCRELNKDFNFGIAKKLYRIGLETFKKERYKRKIKSEALPLVKFLHNQGDVLVILTKGDKTVQGDKRRVLKQIGLLRYFKEFIIVDDNKENAFRDIQRRYKAKRYFSIGDTYGWDILPAIKLG